MDQSYSALAACRPSAVVSSTGPREKPVKDQWTFFPKGEEGAE